MTDTTARSTANFVLITAGMAVAYVILTTPSLRRFTARAVHSWLGASVPAYLLSEIRRAWVETEASSAEIVGRAAETA